MTASGTCLVVDADFVSIDLGGYGITGDGPGCGISDNSSPRQGIWIRNGTIATFSTAIRLDFSAATPQGSSGRDVGPGQPPGDGDSLEVA